MKLNEIVINAKFGKFEKGDKLVFTDGPDYIDKYGYCVKAGDRFTFFQYGAYDEKMADVIAEKLYVDPRGISAKGYYMFLPVDRLKRI